MMVMNNIILTGGFHLGLQMAGFKFDQVYYSDIDEYANKIYQLRFPDAIPLGDITKIDKNNIRKIINHII